MQKVSNKLVTLERQTQNRKPFQPQYLNPHYNNMPPYQNQAPYNLNRPMGSLPIVNTSANPIRTIVPQNNLSQEKGYCVSYYYPYE